MPDIAFIDFETRSLCDLPSVGGYVYARHHSTDATVLAYAFGDDFGKVWSPSWCWGNTEVSEPDAIQPQDLLEHVRAGRPVVAWNAHFDRHIWNTVMVGKYGWPALKIEQVYCAMAQAEANNLPGSLEKACAALGTNYQKDPAGKRLISLLAVGDRETWDSEANETPDKMGHFRVYAVKDVLAMRDVWQFTRPLTAPEWEEYHASEHINDRGVAVDREFAQAAQQYALAESRDINGELAEITGDNKVTITNHVRKAAWLHSQLWPHEEIQSITEKPPKNDKPRYTADRSTREAVLDLLALPENAALFEPDHLDDIIRFVELVEAGNSAAVHKYKAIAATSGHDGRVHGMYAFNGAGQTGRFSSRGVQTHNLIRSPLVDGDPDAALDAIDMITDGLPAETIVKRFNYPISRVLARLLRPTFVAPEGKMLLWGDWEQIEARVLPWLAKSTGAERKLDLFWQGEDVYKYAASPIFSKPIEDIDKDERQVGKVSELSLGFGGAAGAFKAMARNYGVALPTETVKQIVTRWRDANGWCVEFWHQLWTAAINAFHAPGNWFPAGRVQYLYHPNLMRGTLICKLPDGRWLVYPQFEHKNVVVKEKDKDGVEVERIKLRTSFVKGFPGGYGRVDLWYGILAENITQATAASFLRNALVELQDEAVLHTHDEVVLEIDDDPVVIQESTEYLTEVMEHLPEWADGLPLSVEIEHGPFYTK